VAGKKVRGFCSIHRLCMSAFFSLCEEKNNKKTEMLSMDAMDVRKEKKDQKCFN
jgi:hypothetical protein